MRLKLKSPKRWGPKRFDIKIKTRFALFPVTLELDGEMQRIWLEKYYEYLSYEPRRIQVSGGAIYPDKWYHIKYTSTK